MLTAGRRPNEFVAASAGGSGGAQHLPFPDKLRGEAGCPTAFTRRTAKNQRITAVLDDCVRIPVTVCCRHLRNRLETQYTPTIEFSHPRECILQSVYLPQ